MNVIVNGAKEVTLKFEKNTGGENRDYEISAYGRHISHRIETVYKGKAGTGRGGLNFDAQGCGSYGSGGGGLF